MTKETVRFCPQCGSPAVSSKETDAVLTSVDPSSDVFTCSGCGWAGVRSDLVVTEFEHDFGGRDEIMNALMADLRGLLAKTFAKSFGSFLLKWGFLATPINPLHLARYTAAVARAVLTSVLEERTKLEKEARSARH